MYNIDWNIEFTTDGKKYKLGLLAEAEITASVDNLTDVAVIVLPETVINEPLALKISKKQRIETNIIAEDFAICY